MSMSYQTARWATVARGMTTLGQGNVPAPASPGRGCTPSTLPCGPAALAPRPREAVSGASPSSSAKLAPRDSRPGSSGHSALLEGPLDDVQLHEPPPAALGAAGKGAPSWCEWAVASAGQVRSFVAQVVSAGTARLRVNPVTAEDLQQAQQDLMNELRKNCPSSVRKARALELGPGPTPAAFDPVIRALASDAAEPSDACEREALSILEMYIGDGVHPAQDSAKAPAAVDLAQQMVHEAADLLQGGDGAGRAAGSLLRAGGVLLAFLRRVNKNEDFESTPATVAASVANVAMRNALAVFLPTVIRQFLSYGIEAGLTRAGASDSFRTTLGLVAPMLAVGALALGAMRDRMAGTYKPTSERSRAIMATTTAVAGLATAASGAMPAVAPLMVAFTAYTAMRDLLVQSRLRMSNANTNDYDPDAVHFALISAGYGLDQGLVSLGMSTLASPSGAGAYVKHAGVQAWNAIRRGALNWAGEVGEDLMFQGIPAVRSTLDPAKPSHALQLSIHDEGYQQNNLVNAALGPWAVRTGILSTTIGGLSMLSAYTGGTAYAKDPRLVEAVHDLIIGAVNGILYEPFANSGSAQPRTASGPRDLAAPFDSGRFLGSMRFPLDPEAGHPQLDPFRGSALFLR